MSKRLTEGKDYYVSSSGLMVFTAAYHQERGYCCGQGCLHCPYDYVNVSEPKRSQLRQAQSGDGKHILS